ncbi:hypothetical protein BJY16_003691 [Actinoplanes octamycinicus]|uniref:Uncharacterized protein n=1 Tax=Actinoplanes octamycinicus TaxID=135948 RepID=A0A7W7GXT8_9ACTN|nr:hypothetical protein [Actinoplanes octamycinicus]
MKERRRAYSRGSPWANPAPDAFTVNGTACSVL